MVEDASDDIDLVRFVISKYEAKKEAANSIMFAASVGIKRHKVLFIIRKK